MVWIKDRNRTMEHRERLRRDPHKCSQLIFYKVHFSSVQSLSHVWLFVTPWTTARQVSLSFSNSWSPPKPMSIESVMHPAISSSVVPFSFCPQSFPFSNESALHIRWPKYWSFSFSISPSNENSGLISSRMDWLDLFAFQRTLKSLLQHHSTKASFLQHSAFFTVQLSHPYITTGKTIALTRQTFVDKVMSLLFNMLSRLVITFLPRSGRLLISWLQSPSAVILEPRKIKSATLSTVFPSICHQVMGVKQIPWSKDSIFSKSDAKTTGQSHAENKSRQGPLALHRN